MFVGAYIVAAAGVGWRSGLGQFCGGGAHNGEGKRGPTVAGVGEERERDDNVGFRESCQPRERERE